MGLFRRSGVEQRTITAADVIDLVNDRRRYGNVPMEVTIDSAMRLSAVWACIRLLAGLGSTLPLDQQRTRNGVTVEVTRSPLFDMPQPETTLSTWLYQAWSSMLTDGNIYGLVTSIASNGYPTSVELIDPGMVQWRPEGDHYWCAVVDGVELDRWPNGPLWHVPIFTLPGQPFGLSPIKHAKQTITAGLSAERFGSDFFHGGGTPNAILYSDTELSSDQAQGIKSAFVRSTAGNREPMVVGAGLRYERVSVPPDEAQFLDAQRFTVEQIARLYGIAPEMIGGATSGSSVTYANREQRSQDFLTFGLMPYLVALEDGLSALIPRPQRVRFNVDGVLRSDLKTRYEAHAIALSSAFMTVDEVRQIEDLPPMPEPVEDTPEDQAEDIAEGVDDDEAVT
jgi:HK97 family phage portal protein